jgi:exosome complex exonuclease DIS3/RRP44
LHFYAGHLNTTATKPPQLVLLSDDRRNRELAASEGLLAASTRDYVDGLVPVERERLVDLVVGGVDATDPSERRAGRIYDEYLDDDELNAGVKSGKYFQGFFNASQYNYLEVG